MKKPEGIQVNDELMDDDGTTWQVTHVADNGVVVATPLYHRLHRRFWARFPYLQAAIWKAQAEAYAKYEAESAEAEIQAETNIPQHLVW